MAKNKPKPLKKKHHYTIIAISIIVLFMLFKLVPELHEASDTALGMLPAPAENAVRVVPKMKDEIVIIIWDKFMWAVNNIEKFGAAIIIMINIWLGIRQIKAKK